MTKIIILGAGSMSTAFAYPCSDNKHDVSIVGTFLENDFIDELNKNHFHSGLNLEVLKTIKFFKHDSILQSLNFFGVDHHTRLTCNVVRRSRLSASATFRVTRRP